MAISTSPKNNSQISSPFAGLIVSKTTFNTVVLLYESGAILALLPALSGSFASALSRLLLVTSSVGLYFFISYLLNTATRLKWLVLLTISATGLIGVLGTAQVDLSGLRLSGFNQSVYSDLSFLRNLSIMQKLPHVNQNVLGGLLSTFLPLALAFVFWGRPWWLRLYSAFCALVVTTMLIATGSRGALIGLGASILVLIWFALSRFPRLRVITFFLLSMLSIPTLIYLMADFLPQVENGTSRLQLWNNVVRLIGDYPFTGAGLGQFQTQSSLHGIPDKHAHNLFLQSWVEFGILGFVAILIMVTLTLRLLWYYRNVKRLPDKLRPIVIGCLAGQLALFGNGLVEYGSWGGKFAPVFLVIPAILSGCQLDLPKLGIWQQFREKVWTRKFMVLGVSFVAFFLLFPLLLINIGGIISKWGVSQPLYQLSAILAPWNATPQRNLAQIALVNGDTNAAQSYYKAAFDRDEGDWRTLMFLADMSEKQGDHTQALVYWRKAVTAPYFVGLALQNGQSKVEMEKDLKLALELDPANQQALQLLLGEYNSTGRSTQAQALLRQLLAQHPTPSLLEQASVMAASPQDAIQYLQQAVKSDPGNAGYLWELGNAYQATSQLEQSEAAYKQALAIRSVDQRPIRSLAQLYLTEKRPQEAITLLESFVAQHLFIETPNREYDLLAQAYLATDNYSAASTAAQEALHYNQRDLTALLALGDSWRFRGDKVQARDVYNQVLAIDPNNAAATQALDLLK